MTAQREAGPPHAGTSNARPPAAEPSIAVPSNPRPSNPGPSNAGPPASGHNGGPPLQDDPDAAWRLWCWRRAHKRAWSAPREVALRRLARAEELGMTYREYTLEILERGRYL